MTRQTAPSRARAADTPSLADQVREYLAEQPRQLPSSALYDALGSALFDAICLLPWYPVTRAERRLIAANHGAILTAAGSPTRLLELGCGNGEKLNVLLGVGASPVARVDLVDVSASALAAATRTITERRTVSVVTHHARYEEGLEQAVAGRPADDRLCVMLLGSNIGNFDPDGARAFLAAIRRCLRSGDTLLIGADLVKPEPELLLAYDDPLGVTAAFNKNLLVRLNRELGANFDVTQFAHRAVWNPQASRIEMHLVSRVAQRARIPAADLDVDFEEGETIWTESSYKYEEPTVAEFLGNAGFTPRRHWIDAEGRFLLAVASAS